MGLGPTTLTLSQVILWTDDLQSPVVGAITLQRSVIMTDLFL
jgi:hypothetical protein